MDHQRRIQAEQGYPAVPRAAAPPINLANFMLCGLPVANPMLAAWQQELYRWAFAQAQAVAQPSIVERDLLAVWN